MGDPTSDILFARIEKLTQENVDRLSKEVDRLSKVTETVNMIGKVALAKVVRGVRIQPTVQCSLVIEDFTFLTERIRISSRPT